MARRTLYDAPLLRVEHIVARPHSPEVREVAAPGLNGLVLPLSGVFARHASARRRSVATPGHAFFFPAGRPYAISFPGCIGDEVLSLQWSSEALAAHVPQAARAFDAAAEVLLGPRQMVRRSILWSRLARDEADPLEVEELCAELLGSSLRIAPSRAPGRRPIEDVKAAVALAPERKWTLADLAEVARMSTHHLAHVFRAEVGVSAYAYVVRARLAKALPEVADPGRDITAIALDAGFASHSHFTARFRAHFGLTPRDLRRRGAARIATSAGRTANSARS